MFSRSLRGSGISVASKYARLNRQTGISLLRPNVLRPQAPLTAISIENFRGFRRFEVKSPLGIKLLRLSRQISIGMIAFYVLGGLAIAFVYVRDTWKSGSAQRIPKDWPARVQSLVREAVNHEIDNKFDRALAVYKLAIKEMTTEEDKATGEIVPIDDLSDKSPQWLGGYSDVLFRYARIEELLDNHDEAKEALLASEQIPWGSPKFKSLAAIQLAKYALIEGDKKKAEEYHLNSVKAVATPIMNFYFKEGPDFNLRKAVLIPDFETEKNVPSKYISSKDGKSTGEGVTPQLYHATIELGKFYASTGRYIQALEVLLSTLRSIRRKRGSGDEGPKAPDPGCFEALTMSYISEILWATGKDKREEAITWAEGSFFEAKPLSNSTVECGLCAEMVLENLTKMYTSFGLPEEAANCQQRLEEIHPPFATAS